MLWTSIRGGAVLTLERPNTDPRDEVTLTVEWHQSPDPKVVAAMIRTYEFRGRRRACWVLRVLGLR